jgi:CheY-like chemotaxis protein/anti-sigma regulatory factor (Ser/Thr protein kinase)
VLDVSGIEAGRIDVRNGTVALSTSLDEAFAFSHALARQSGVQLVAAYRQSPPLGALADPGRLRQVLINLMSNAIKYNRAGGSVRLGLSRRAGRVAIEIVDTGIGMTAEQLAHLYEPFNRLGRERGGIEGAGIGLALTRQLVRLMQGELTIESEVGRGTRAVVELGHADFAVPAVPAATALAPLARSAPPAATILYIEDNEVNVVLVEQMLAHWPQLRFLHAADGRSGIEYATELQPDLVLLDMQLPDISGLEVLRILRQQQATRTLRIVALSASAMADEVQQARLCGADDYWTKPLDLDGFLASVARVLRRGPLVA